MFCLNKKTTKKIFVWFLSGAIAVVLHFFIFYWIDLNFEKFKQEQVKILGNYIEIQSVDKIQSQITANTKKENKKELVTKTSKRDFKNIVPKLSLEYPSKYEDGKIFLNEKQVNETKDIGYAFANSLDVKEDAKLTSFMHTIWKKISTKVIYPDDFIKQRIQGEVTLQFKLNNRGQFAGGIISSESENLLLKIYVASIIPHALKDSLPESLWLKQENIPIVLRFYFKNYGPTEAIPEVKPEYFKNIVTVRKYGFVDPWLTEQINRAYTNYFPPLIPVPGGFFIDFIRAYELIKNMHTQNQDEKRELRIELLKEEWESIIQKKSPND